MHGGFGGIPFGAGFGGGGFDGGRGASSGPVDTTKLYETLEVEKSATQKEIKKAYFKLSKLHHPDKGGDEHKFKEISAAYEILSDPEKREKYDKYGLEGVVEDGEGPAGAEDLFSMFFGGGGRGRRSAGPRKGASLNHPLKCTLEDLYNGKTVKLAVRRKVIVGESSTCTKCRGQGVVMEVRQIGPGMITQMQRACPECGGQGHTAKTKDERNVLEVHVEKGMKHNSKITFRGMADEIPGQEAGDVNFVVQEQDHDLFKRKGADLLLEKTISLNQSLTGFSVRVVHQRFFFTKHPFSLLFFVCFLLLIVENQTLGQSRNCHQDTSRTGHPSRRSGRCQRPQDALHHDCPQRRHAQSR